jgi:putative membrane protein
MNAMLQFFMYFATAVLLLTVFIWVYVKSTPYNEFALIKQNNAAAALSLSGATVGFAMPLAASIYFTHDIVEMLKWALITGVAQLLLFWIMRRYAADIERGQIAPAIFLAGLSLATGLLNAISISY